MIPEEWELRTLQDCGITVIDGDRGKEYPSSDDFFDEGYCLFLSAKNVTKAGFVFDDCQFINETKHKQLRKGSVQPGDLVLTTRGTVGNVGYLRDLNGFGAVRINSGMVVVRNSQKCIETDFLHALFRSPVVEKQIERMNFGSAQPQLTVKIVNSLKLPIPPVRERQRITGALETWDRAIETVEALIANARAQKKALMQQLLPQGTTLPEKRLPGFSGEWREVSLADLLSVKRAKGKIVPTNENADGVPYIGSTSFLGEFSNYTTSTEALLCVETDILVLWDGENAGKVATGLSGAVSSTVGRYRLAKAKADPVFVVSLMEKASERIRSIREGSGIPHMPGDFEHWFKFALPPLDEQRAIAEVFKATRVMADELQSQLTALRQEKAALMQQLLTGKRRVKLPESEVA